MRLIKQDHGGPGVARNRGVKDAKGDVIIFIDSDLIVTESFLESHALTLNKAWLKRGYKYCFTYGSVINTSDFENPTLEPFKATELSWAYFATGNVAID